MSPTLLELVMVIILIYIAWQISLAVAPGVVEWFRNLWRDPDKQELAERDSTTIHKEEHTNGTHR